jgi:hypothetical protein
MKNVRDIARLEEVEKSKISCFNPNRGDRGERLRTPESTERLSSLLGKVRADELTELYERHKVDNVPDLVTEIRRDGSSTIATWGFRSGEGVHYDEIVMDG